MENNLNTNDIKNFLIGVSDHLKNELYSFNYQNTFKDHQEFKSDEENSKKLLSQCEILLNRLSIYNLQCQKCCIEKDKTKSKENSEPVENNCSSYELGLIRNDEKKFGSYDTVATESSYETYLIMNMKQKKHEPSVSDYVDFKSFAASDHRLSLNESFRNISKNDFSSLTSTPITKRNSIGNTLKTDEDHNYDLCSNLIDSSAKNSGKKITHQNVIKTAIAKLSNEKLELERIPEKFNNYRHKRSKSFDSNNEGKLINLKALSCPFIGLPLAHLAIYKSIKHGYLLRIEKRFLFDQTKKVYCGIINEWLLCYSCDGISENPIKKIDDHIEKSEPNSGSTDSNENIEKYRFIGRNNTELRNRLSLCTNQLKPIQCIHLKDLTIEHYRESKRRDIQFQIYSNSGLENHRNKFIFQAQNEIDCKEWILAIEACKRGDYDEQLNPNEHIQVKQENLNDPTTKPTQFTINFANNLRRLPTPPQSPEPLCCCNMQHFNENNLDDIYEDPGAWLKTIEENKMKSELQPPELPVKTNRKSLQSNMELTDCITNYDIPKCYKPKVDSLHQLQKKDSTDIEAVYEKYSTDHGKITLIEQSQIYDSPKKIDKILNDNASNNLNTKKLLILPNPSRLHSEFNKAQFQVNNINNKNVTYDNSNRLVLTKTIEINDQQQDLELLPNKSSIHELNKNKEEFQMKIKNIHSKLSNQLLNNSPEQRYKKLQQNKKLNKSNNYDNELIPNKKSPIPIKNWFLNRIKTNANNTTLQ